MTKCNSDYKMRRLLQNASAREAFRLTISNYHNTKIHTWWKGLYKSCREKLQVIL